MPSIEYMRNELKKLYDKNMRWVQKVNRMADRQVMAIYLKEQQRIEEEKKDKPPNDELPF